MIFFVHVLRFKTRRSEPQHACPLYVTLTNATAGQGKEKTLRSTCNGSIKRLSHVHDLGPLLADTRINSAFGARPVSSADVPAEQVVRCELSLRAPRSSETATPSTLLETVAVRKNRAGHMSVCCAGHDEHVPVHNLRHTPPKIKAVGKIQVRGYESTLSPQAITNKSIPPQKDKASIKLFLPHFASRRLGRLHMSGPV